MMNSSCFSEVRPGPVTMLSTGTSRRPFAPDDHARRARGDQRRNAVGRGRRIAEIAGERRPALYLRRADQVGGLDDAGPGLLERFVFADHRAGGRGADDEGAVLLANAGDAGDFLGIDDQVRLGAAGPELNQQIGPAGQDLRNAGGSGQYANGLLDRRRGGIGKHGHGVSRASLGRNASPAPGRAGPALAFGFGPRDPYAQTSARRPP